MTTDGDVDLDLYADVEGGEFSHEGGYEDNQNENGAELFDDVIVPSANNDFPDLNGNSSSGINKPLLDPPSMPSQNYPGKRVSCYVGNLTWWTTDQDLTDSINSIGISDLIEIKFYENKINGQSKGFAVVTVGSEPSFRCLMEKLPKKELNDQAPVVTYFSKHNLNQFEAQARKDSPNDQTNRGRNIPPNVPSLPLVRPGILPRPGMPPGLVGQPQLGMPGMQMQRPGMQQRPGGLPIQQHIRLGSGGGMQMNPVQMNRPQNSALMPNPSGQGLLRGPPTGHRMQGPIDPRGPQPRAMEWDNRQGGHPQGFQPQNQMNQRGPPGPGVPQHGGPGHMNPAFFQQNGMPHQLHHQQGPHGQMPPNHVQQLQPGSGGSGQHHENTYYRPNERQEMFVNQQISDEEFLEIMEKNKSVSSSAISRAVTDASAGDYASAIQTLVMAMSLIKQSKIANDDRCKILISSLQDTLKGIEDKYYGGGGGNSRVRSGSRDSRERTRRSRSRDSRERDSRRRDKQRHRSRSRERRDYYEDTRSYHRSRH